MALSTSVFHKKINTYDILFLALLTLFVLDVTSFSLYAKPAHGPDEQTHYGNMWFLTKGYRFDAYSFEQPLYYLASLPFYYIAKFSAHSETDLIHYVRFISIGMGSLTVVFIYKISQIVFHKDKWLALFATAFVAFLPTFDWINSVVNNDVLDWLLSTISIYFLLKFVNDLQKKKFLIMCAIFASLAISTKYNSLVIYAVVLVALCYLLFSKKISKSFFVKNFALFVGVAIAASSWHMIYLAENGNDPFDFGFTGKIDDLLVHHHVVAGTTNVNATKLSLGYVTDPNFVYVRLFQFSFSADIPYLWAPPDLLNYAYYFLIASVIGLIFLTVRRKHILQHLELRGIHIIILFSLVILLVASVFANWLFTEVGLTRYTFPAISGFGVLFTLGLFSLIQKRRLKFILLVPLGLLIAMNISLLLLLITADAPPDYTFLPFPTQYYASSQLVPWTGPEKAFDNNNGTEWHSADVSQAGLPKIHVLYYEPHVFNHVQITAGNLWFPENFDIEASNNGENYTILKSVTDESGWTSHSIHEYSFPNDNAYHYYMISVRRIQNDNHYVEMTEIKFSNIPLPPQYFATSQLVPWTGPEKAFDNDISTVWHSGNVTWTGFPQNIGLVYQKPQTFNHVQITAGNIWHPENFDVEASNNGKNYTILKSVTGESGWTSHSIHEYSFPNDNAYSYYRLSITRIQNDNHYVEIDELKFSNTK